MLKQTHNQSLSILQQEIEMLRSLVISTVGRDKEGDYNPSFIKKVIMASKEKAAYCFEDEKSFLKQLG